jgi:hypothetical protein
MTPQEFNYTFRIEKVSFPYLTENDTVYRIRQRNIKRKFNWSLFKFETVESWKEAPIWPISTNDYADPIWSDGSNTFSTLEAAENSLNELRRHLLSQYKTTELV